MALLCFLPPPPPTLEAPERNLYLSRIRNWLKRRIALVWPAACFLAGCAISYAVTLRYQWQSRGFGSDDYLAEYYYQGKLDAYPIFEFSIGGIWDLLTYHLPVAVAIAALAAFAIFLAAALFRKFQGGLQDRAIAVLFSFCIAVSVGAAVLGIYPLGGIRQVIYLGPVVFLAAGVAFHWTADWLASLTGRGWLASALAVAVVGGIVLAGVGDIRQDSPYKTNVNVKSVLAVLEERVREEDMVYAVYGAYPAIKFYQGKEESPANYYYGSYWCTDSGEPCLRGMVDLLLSLSNVPNRIFLVHTHESILEELELLGEQVSVEYVIAARYFNVTLIENVKESVEPAIRAVHAALVSEYEAIVSGEPVIRSGFDVYLSDNTLVYAKEPCTRADTEAMFFLAPYPVDVNDLPEKRQQYGFDNLDFGFRGRGMIFDGKCMAAVPLPEYDIVRISTGQYVRAGWGYDNLWEGEFLFDGAE